LLAGLLYPLTPGNSRAVRKTMKENGLSLLSTRSIFNKGEIVALGPPRISTRELLSPVTPAIGQDDFEVLVW
jgi:hypothetical protein